MDYLDSCWFRTLSNLPASCFGTALSACFNKAASGVASTEGFLKGLFFRFWVSYSVQRTADSITRKPSNTTMGPPWGRGKTTIPP